MFKGEMFWEMVGRICVGFVAGIILVKFYKFIKS